MARWKLAIVGLACLPMLGACHTDPFKAGDQRDRARESTR